MGTGIWGGGTRKYSIHVKHGEHAKIGPRGGVTKWRDHTSGATEDYKRGVKNPRRPWGKCTCEASDRYKAGVDKAHSRGAFSRGVKRKGTRGWRIPSIRKGPARWNQGIFGSGNDYARGFAPYHAMIPSIFMPKRFPRGDPRNIDRCRAICTGFGQKKVSLGGEGKLTCPSK